MVRGVKEECKEDVDIWRKMTEAAPWELHRAEQRARTVHMLGTPINWQRIDVSSEAMKKIYLLGFWLVN